MCGRYAIALSNEEVYDALQNQLPQMFEQGRPRWERPQDHRPNYNHAPRQRAPVIHRDADSGQPIIETMQWGLIPHWTKHPPTGGLNTINARSEGLLDSTSGGMWHALKAHKRCIVPAQGYFEWHKRPSAKIAHFARLPLTPKHTNANPPLVFFAGLYDVVKYLSPVESKFQPREDDDREPYPTGNPIPLATYTILTTSPAKDISWLHDRMPCVLTNWEDIARWLDLGEVKGWEEGKGGTGALLTSTPGLDCFPVPPEVGKIGTNSPTFIEPVSERSDGIKSFFTKQSPAKKGPAQTPAKAESKPDTGSKAKSRAKELKSEIVDGDEEQDLGDDSNAPNPVKSEDEKPSLKREASEEISTPSKRNRKSAPKEEPIEVLDDEDAKKPSSERKGGHQTKVVRKTEDEGNEAQPAITSFFKSPAKPAKPKPETRTSAPRRAKK